jgi:hypothetical protein
VGARHELTVDGPGAELTQIARLLQFAPQAKHKVLDGRCGPLDSHRDRRTIAPVDAIQRQLAGTSAPPLDGGEAHPMRTCDRAHRRAGANLSHDRAPLLFAPSQPFLPMASYSHGFTQAS